MCCAPGFAPGARSLFLAVSRLCALGGGDDLLVEKVIDYQRRGREGATDGVVVAHVGQALSGGEGANLPVQRRPVAAVAVDVNDMRILFMQKLMTDVILAIIIEGTPTE